MDSTPPNDYSGPSLAHSITTTTRSIHTKLNKMIIARLPLALPPNSTDPTIYVSGLLHVTPIYNAFEDCWQSILHHAPTSHLDPDQGLLGVDREATAFQKTHDGVVGERLHKILQQLHLPGLMRSDRLRADIRALTGWNDNVVNEQLHIVSQMQPLSDFISHIKRTIDLKPHVLVAYSYILFMALFAGGRFIRATLESAGEEFWASQVSPIRPTLRECNENAIPIKEAASQLSDAEAIAKNDNDDDDDIGIQASSHASHTFPLRFLHFLTRNDGEDLKQEFKQRLAEAEIELSSTEKDDIVREASCIFEHMILLMQQLDLVHDESTPSSERKLSFYALGQLLNPLGLRMRDSVSVIKARKTRLASKNSLSSTDESTTSVVHRPCKSTDSSPLSISSGESANEFPTTLSSYTGIQLCPAMSPTSVYSKSSIKISEDPTCVDNDRLLFQQSTWIISRVAVSPYAIAAAVGVVAIGFMVRVL